MSADWFFMKKGFFGKSKTVGPIAESDFLHKIEKGEISPETMVSSTSKTHGHWMHLKENPCWSPALEEITSIPKWCRVGGAMAFAKQHQQ